MADALAESPLSKSAIITKHKDVALPFALYLLSFAKGPNHK